MNRLCKLITLCICLATISPVFAGPLPSNVVLYGNVFLSNGTPANGATYNSSVYDNSTGELLSTATGLVGEIVGGIVYESQNTPNSAGDTFNVAVVFSNETGEWSHVITPEEFEMTIVHMPDMTLSLKPDLLVTNISYSPGAPKNGEQILINATISNSGDNDAVNFETELLIDGISIANNTASVISGSSTVVSFTWNVTSETHIITVRADSLDSIDELNELNNENEISISLKRRYNLTLTQGLNLISIPLDQDNWTITSVLASIDGNYTVVYAYIDGYWKYTTARNPLTEMDLEHGYWIEMTAPDTLELSGTVPSATTINVTTGWSLVGYPSLTTENITTVLAGINYTAVYAYIDGSWKFTTARNPLTEMTPGYGYWIDTSDTTPPTWDPTPTDPPSIAFTDQTPVNGTVTGDNHVYVNTSISDDSDVTGFIDWNRSLASYWRFEESAGSAVADSSLHGNNGTIYGAVSSGGKFGNALNFDGIDDYVEIENPDLNLTDEVTIEAWVKPVLGSRGPVAARYVYNYSIPVNDRSFEFSINSSGNVEFALNSNGMGAGTVWLTSGGAVIDGAWNHVVATSDGTTMRIYINGVLDLATAPAPSVIYSPERPIQIGAWIYGVAGETDNDYFNGAIDEVKIHRRALSPQEINASYDSKLYGLERNFTSLGDGSYAYYACAQDAAGNYNCTGTRDILIDTAPPSIAFTDQTPVNGTVTGDNHVYVNTSIGDDSDVTGFIDWNRSLASYWRFEESAGSAVADSSLHGNNGTIYGAVSSGGKFGNALNFDGIDDYVEIENPDLNLTDEVTIEAWVKPVLGSRGPVAARYVYNYSIPVNDRSFVLSISNGGNVEFALSSNGTGAKWLTSGGAVIDGAWNHVVATSDGTTMRIYINGVLDLATAPAPSVIYSPERPIQIGAWIYGVANETDNDYFNGAIDEVKIHRRALSPQEINASYDSKLYGLERNFTSLGDGSYAYYACAQDAAGNYNCTGTRDILIDTAPPVINFVQPVDNFETTSRNWTFISVTLTEPASWIRLEWNGNNESMSRGSTNRYLNKTDLTNGNYTYRVWANDSAGNMNASETRQITIDSTVGAQTTPPAITMSSPQNMTYTASNVPLNVSADEMIKTWWYSLNGDEDTPFTPNTTITGEEGLNSIVIYANDSAGNLGAVEIYFTIDTTRPDVTITATQNSTYSLNLQVINATITDALSDIDTVIAEINGSVNVTLDKDGNYYNATYTFSEGQNNVRIHANDTEGNMNDTEIVYFTIAKEKEIHHSGGGGGGGGGTKGASATVSVVKAEKASTFAFSDAESEFVSEIMLTAKQARYNAKITVETFESKPYASLPDPEGVAYKYLKITTSNIPTTSIDKVDIKFKVEITWLKENDINPSTVALNRNVQKRWDVLATTRTGGDDTYVYYTAETPGFSHFAIIAEEGSGYVEEAVPIETHAPTIAPQAATPAPTMPVLTTPAPTALPVTPVSMPAPPMPPTKIGIALMLMVVIVVGGYVFVKRKKV